MLSWSKQVRKPQSQMFVVKNVFWCSCCADVSERVLSGSCRDQPKQKLFNQAPNQGSWSYTVNILKLWMAYFLHELMQHVYSSPSFEKTVVTDLKFELLISFLNRCNVFFKSLFRKYLCSQISHLNGLFPSWTDETCSFKLLFWEYL